MLTTIYNIESNVENSNIIQISLRSLNEVIIQTELTNNFILLFLYNSIYFIYDKYISIHS